MTTDFCANPACALHVTRDSPLVVGHGEWARLGEIWVSRSRYGGRLLCDLCGRAELGVRDTPGARGATPRALVS